MTKRSSASWDTTRSTSTALAIPSADGFSPFGPVGMLHSSRLHGPNAWGAIPQTSTTQSARTSSRPHRAHGVRTTDTIPLMLIVKFRAKILLAGETALMAWRILISSAESGSNSGHCVAAGSNGLTFTRQGLCSPQARSTPSPNEFCRHPASHPFASISISRSTTTTRLTRRRAPGSRSRR